MSLFRLLYILNSFLQDRPNFNNRYQTIISENKSLMLTTTFSFCYKASCVFHIATSAMIYFLSHGVLCITNKPFKILKYLLYYAESG
ncbi:hypothetical protein HanRHA438_Chr03g0111911 [Helianthus annuus]|nr:hypothetical protein HanHA300_Chr03g0083971 [Helianthus annuus]KAJ0599875.1 hypothetical protein HanIR_Chr03g0110071 [Helianthus annuus]KAJ0934817.1 hypothetical protein HanRHA438_Chr03g0111911 [Helianthus annuus]